MRSRSCILLLPLASTYYRINVSTFFSLAFSSIRRSTSSPSHFLVISPHLAIAPRLLIISLSRHNRSRCLDLPLFYTDRQHPLSLFCHFIPGILARVISLGSVRPIGISSIGVRGLEIFPDRWTTFNSMIITHRENSVLLVHY